MSEGQQDPAGSPAPTDGAEASTSSAASVAGLNLGAAASDEAAEPARVCEVSLDEFEGPLDLLLHLVRRHELDILDIPIAFVCEKYLEYIEFMRAMELEVAGDYLVMAATLAYLKSRELVPQHEEEAEPGVEEDGPDPREQLIARLLEFQKFKDAAQQLDDRPMSGRDTFGRGQEVELPPVDAGLAPITLFRLAEAYQRVLDRARIHKSHEVVMETISVAARMNQLTGLLLERGSFDFENIFLEQKWSSEGELRSMLVVTLMSVLELVRMGIASVRQDLGADSIVVERVATEDAAKAALADYDEAASFGTAKAKGDSDKGEGEDEEQAEGEGDGDSAEAADASSEEPVPEGSEVVDAAIDPEEMHAEAANDLGAEIQGGGEDFSLEPTADVVPVSREVEGVADELSGLATPDREGAVAEVERELEAVLSRQTEAESVEAEAVQAEVDPALVEVAAEQAESEPIEVEAEQAVAEPIVDDPQLAETELAPEPPTVSSEPDPSESFVVEPSAPVELSAESDELTEQHAAPVASSDPEPQAPARDPEAAEAGEDADAAPQAAGSPDTNESILANAGVSDRSGVSESPPSAASADGMRGDEATGSTDGDDEEHGENGETEAVEGS